MRHLSRAFGLASSARLFAAAASLLVACSSSNPDSPPKEKDAGLPDATRHVEAGMVSSDLDSTGGSTESVEWVSYHTTIPFNAADFHDLASGLFGSDAQSGKLITEREIAPGLYLTSIQDPSTPAQSRVSLTFDDGSPTRRTLGPRPRLVPGRQPVRHDDRRRHQDDADRGGAERRQQ